MGRPLGKIQGVKTFVGIKEFLNKTPELLKKIGNGLIAASAASAAIVWVQGYEKVAIWLAIGGVVGRFLVSFVGEANPNYKKDEQ